MAGHRICHDRQHLAHLLLQGVHLVVVSELRSCPGVCLLEHGYPLRLEGLVYERKPLLVEVCVIRPTKQRIHDLYRSSLQQSIGCVEWQVETVDAVDLKNGLQAHPCHRRPQGVESLASGSLHVLHHGRVTTHPDVLHALPEKFANPREPSFCARSHLRTLAS